jgi:cysteine desulfurase NifS
MRKPVSGRIYLDHNATTYLDPEVRQSMAEFSGKCYGNPSSVYCEGKEAKDAMESARREVAQLIDCAAESVVFTGCGSESNNLVLKGLAFASRQGKNRIITSAIEHPSVIEACRWLEKFDIRTTYLKVDKSGIVDPSDLEAAVDNETFLISIMLANNETGSIQPIAELASMAAERGILFHTDATQAIGKIPVDVEGAGVDLLSMSAHKFYGPKGAGALFIRHGVEMESLIHGGGQENGRRAGTENVVNIIGLGKAAKLAAGRLPKMEDIRRMRDRLEQGIRKLTPKAKLNGHETERLPNTLNVTLPGVRGDLLVAAMDLKGVSISPGSACHAGSPKPSYVLLAMGLTEEEAQCSVRISLGLCNTDEEIDRFISILEEILRDSGDSFNPCSIT